MLLLLAGLAFLGYNHEAGLRALGWRRPDRVALLTVASHTTRFTEGADSESGPFMQRYIMVPDEWV